ncbi:MAG: transposase [Bacteroidetes bacterium]|nr:MAG: transposase [Bacteroidota bacterium]
MATRSGYNIINQYGLYFVTFTIVGWVDVFTRKACKTIMVEALQYCVEHKGLCLHAYVIMESHVHLVLSAAANSAGLSAIIRDLKKHTSNEIVKWVRDSGRESRKKWMLMVFKYYAKFNTRNSVYQVWKQDNQPKELLHPEFTLQKIRYIHDNPVVAKIVDQPADYLHSSARNYLSRHDVLLEVAVIDFGIQEGYVLV